MTTTNDNAVPAIAVQIMAAMNAQTQWTQDQLIQMGYSESLKLAEWVIEIRDVLDAATVIDRQTESRLARFNWLFNDIDRQRDHFLRMLGTPEESE